LLLFFELKTAHFVAINIVLYFATPAEEAKLGVGFADAFEVEAFAFGFATLVEASWYIFGFVALVAVGFAAFASPLRWLYLDPNHRLDQKSVLGLNWTLYSFWIYL
jgi:hypothetical protein